MRGQAYASALGSWVAMRNERLGVRLRAQKACSAVINVTIAAVTTYALLHPGPAYS